MERCTGVTVDYRVFTGCVKVIYRSDKETQDATGEERGFSCCQRFSEPVVIT